MVSVHYFKIGNKAESEKHVEARFFTVRANATLGASSNMGWGVFKQCCMYKILYGVNLSSRTSSIYLFFCSNTPHIGVS